MKDDTYPPQFVAWLAIAALVSAFIGVIAGPILMIAWLAKACAVVAGVSLFILVIYLGSEVLNTLR